MEWNQKIAELIETNRIGSTEVADALNKSGVIEGMLPISNGRHVTGDVHYVYAYDETNWPLHEQIQEIPENWILYVDSFNCNEKAIFGDLVSKYLILYKKVKGIVVNGYMRDIPDIRKYLFPIWCKGFTPLGCNNKKQIINDEYIKIIEERKNLMENGILTCDDSGCTLIKSDLINSETYAKLELIELQEDIWSFCINTLKWSTYDTVCLKKYLTMPEVLPTAFRDKLKKINFEK